MESLHINGTSVAPMVDFNLETRILELSGYSRPENVRDFYLPLFEWLEELNITLKKNKALNQDIEQFSFKFKFIYFNSSSAKFYL